MSVDISVPARLGESRLADGRVIGWAEWGREDGVPVLLCPGAATTRSLGFGAGVVDALGARLVSLDRPGLGRSTPLPGKTFRDFAADVGEFTALRGLGRPAIVGNSQGAPFALACAAAGVSGAVAIVSGADEVAAPQFADALPEPLRDLVELTASDPDAAERLFATFDADAMWQMVIDSSPASDLAVYRDPTFEASYRSSMREAFAPGPAGYARDTVLAMGSWPIDLTTIRVPVDIWYGDQDTSHSPDHGESLAARIPGAVRHLVPGIGGAVLWTHAEPILRTLLGHADPRDQDQRS
ncbi:pimeloyl-ACP methyl ester carboxylesterase [Rhodococcus sp. AG1013]|uniref:alpha/beta fold hydrolase n=1 Tax=Rhodococcus sp. AG1013 TaxID=2183996 RepID=UPI000E2E3C46|nr:alpha/beta hydrolase [Rhodococcus sp. AG1013]RDI16883.1 pimeloyl-ACP methyl ester carboxylesterase [Rhodococcus sp. AG1013]